MKLLKIDGTVLIEGDYKDIKDLLKKNRGADLNNCYKFRLFLFDIQRIYEIRL